MKNLCQHLWGIITVVVYMLRQLLHIIWDMVKLKGDMFQYLLGPDNYITNKPDLKVLNPGYNLKGDKGEEGSSSKEGSTSKKGNTSKEGSNITDNTDNIEDFKKSIESLNNKVLKKMKNKIVDEIDKSNNYEKLKEQKEDAIDEKMAENSLANLNIEDGSDSDSDSDSSTNTTDVKGKEEQKVNSSIDTSDVKVKGKGK